MTEAILHLTAWKHEMEPDEEEKDENIFAVKELTDETWNSRRKATVYNLSEMD